MKPSKRKSVSKSTTATNSCKNDLIGIGIVLTILAIVGGLIYYSEQPKYSVGDCLLNRMSEVRKVVGINDDEYRLRPMKFYMSAMDKYYYIENYDVGADYREIDFVDEKYVEIPCDR